jgi:hypothetical protein
MDPETVLLHQVHPAKLAFDICASIISNVLLWQHRLGVALLARYVPPVVGSVLVIRYADVEGLRDTPQGRYVLEQMPPASVALRLAGDVGIGAWRRRPSWMAAGALMVVAGWSHGLVG